jgi:predicted DNA-binding protein (MmcQ/YjbR family)
MSEVTSWDKVVATLSALCLQLPGAYEEQAWVGTRWRVRKKTFAHVLEVSNGWPPAYAKVAQSNGPIIVMTFRSRLVEMNVHSFSRKPYFRPGWWPDIAGIVLNVDTDWDEVASLVVESYRGLAPKGTRRR